MAETGEEDHIGGVAVMVFCIYILGMILVYLWDRSHPISSIDIENDAGRSLLTQKFPSANRILLVFRIVGFFYWLGIGWIGKWLRDYVEKDVKPRYYMFTHWNLILLTIYYLLGSLACIQQQSSASTGITSNEESGWVFPTWYTSIHRKRLAETVQILFSVCSASALFVSATAFDPEGSFWSYVGHLTNIIWILVELAQNPFILQIRHLWWFMSWNYAYICVTWILVKAFSPPIQKWPYPFLQTDDIQAYSTYLGILFLQLLSFIFIKAVTYGRTKLYIYLQWIKGDDLRAFSSTELTEIEVT